MPKKCHICGAPLQGRQRCYCSPACSAEAAKLRQRVQDKKPRPPSPVYTERPCIDCGRVLLMHIKSKRCPECQHAANLRHDRDAKRRQSSGNALKLATVDLCERCGEPYRVTGGKAYKPTHARSLTCSADCRKIYISRQNKAYRAVHAEQIAAARKRRKRNDRGQD